MKIIVFSDSHGNTSKMISAIEEHRASISLIIHLGDGVRDISYVSSLYPELPVVSIEGNGETFSRSKRILDIDGVRIMCIHGHSYHVKLGTSYAARCAAEENCNLLLYGHTHIADDTVISTAKREVRVFNPGSIGRGYPSSYGIIHMKGKGIYSTSHETF